MSQTQSDTPLSAPSAAGGAAPVQHATAPVAGAPRSGRWLAVLAMVLATLALVMSGLLWEKLGSTQQELARRSQDSATQAADARRLAAQAEALTQELQARLAVAEVRLSEVSLQRSQLEELMLTLSRSRDDNLVQDLESALRLAQQQAQLTGTAQPLISALQAADQRIARAAQPRLNPVQRAIARDIDRIQKAPLADIPGLVLRLDELARQVDEWPVLNEVGPRARVAKNATPKAAGKAAPAVAATPAATAGGSDAAATASTETLPLPDGDALGQGWARVSRAWQALWARIWADVTRSGRELVRVSRIDRPEAALMAPEQAFFLRENLKLKLLNARLGLLARHLTSSLTDVKAVETAMVRYFDTTSPQVGGAQHALAQLRKDLVDNELPRPDETLAALAAAAGGR